MPQKSAKAAGQSGWLWFSWWWSSWWWRNWWYNSFCLNKIFFLYRKFHKNWVSFTPLCIFSWGIVGPFSFCRIILLYVFVSVVKKDRRVLTPQKYLGKLRSLYSAEKRMPGKNFHNKKVIPWSTHNPFGGKSGKALVYRNVVFTMLMLLPLENDDGDDDALRNIYKHQHLLSLSTNR